MPLIRSRHRHSTVLDMLLGLILGTLGLFVIGLGVADILLMTQFKMGDNWLQLSGFDPQQLYFFLGVKVEAEPVSNAMLTPALIRLGLGLFLLWLGWRYLSSKG